MKCLFSKCQFFQLKIKKNWRRLKVIIPIRCFSCGKLIAHIYKPYQELIEKGESPDNAFKKLGIERFCCRRMIVGHVDLIDDLLKFSRLQ